MDASRTAFGAILAQIDKENSEKVCAYASRTLQGTEFNYPVHEQECLAFVWAIKQFREYLYGVKFEVVTDHSMLTLLFKLNDLNARLIRRVFILKFSTSQSHIAKEETTRTLTLFKDLY